MSKVNCKRCGALVHEDQRSSHLLTNCLKPEEIPFKCGICDSKLISSNALDRHAKKVHPMDKHRAIKESKEGTYSKME